MLKLKLMRQETNSNSFGASLMVKTLAPRYAIVCMIRSYKANGSISHCMQISNGFVGQIEPFDGF